MPDLDADRSRSPGGDRASPQQTNHDSRQVMVLERNSQGKARFLAEAVVLLVRSKVR
jgi:hypothetical protein